MERRGFLGALLALPLAAVLRKAEPALPPGRQASIPLGDCGCPIEWKTEDEIRELYDGERLVSRVDDGTIGPIYPGMNRDDYIFWGTKR